VSRTSARLNAQLDALEGELEPAAASVRAGMAAVWAGAGEKPSSRDVRRSRRAREVRKKTIGIRTGIKELRRLALIEEPVDDVARPRTRGECEQGVRPCPFVSCRYHLFLDVTRAGGLTLNFPDLEPEQLVESCALDVALHGGEKLENVGLVMNVTRERVRQLEQAARTRVAAALAAWVEDEDRKPCGRAVVSASPANDQEDA
jgi:hypothetical protein